MINSPLTALVIFVVSTTAVCSADNSCPLFSDFTSGNNTYQHNCSELCLDESQESNTKLQVYGTEYYSKTSDVCQAAVHAGAVGPQGGEVTFTQDNTNHDRRGTIRNRIISKSWLNEGISNPTTFKFLNFTPVIDKEDLDGDVVIIHDSYSKSWTGRKMNLVCLTDNTTRILVKTDITSWKYRKSDVKVTILRSAQQGASLSARKSQNIRAVRCLGRTAATDVLTVIQAKYQTYVADTSTIRASRGDYLQVPIKKVDKNSLDKVFLRRLPDDWSHNNDSYGNYSLPLIFNRVLPGDAGIYIVGNCQECASNPKQFKEMKDLYTDSAYFHLIVRDCESEYYGANCQSRCPDCENGGICHAVTGSCVCPPGFHGPTCQKACGHDLFGSRCQLHCNKITLGFSPESEEHCLGLRICVPEPYGCSCAPGYMGPFCDKKCTEGRYGADCSQGCEYCSDNLCDKTSGKCSSGCLMDIPCADGMPLDLPRLRTPPNVSDIKKNSLVVKFSPWSNEEDDGSDEFNISSYKLQHLREDNNTWVDVKDYFPDIVSGQVTEKIEGLDPGFQYVFRVLVMTPQGAVDGSTNKRVHNVSVTTKCYEPTLYLLNVSEVTNQSAVINWETPGNHARCGMQYDIQLMTGSREEFIHQHTTSNSSYHLRTLKSNTSYVVNITARNNKSEVSLSVQFITLPNAPYRPIVTVMPSGVGNLGVSWKLPPESSSVDSYNVMYKLLQYKACNRTVDPPQDVIQEKTSNNIIELQDLKSYATYEVCVVAENEGGESPSGCSSNDTLPNSPSVDVENFTCTPKNLSGVSCIANLSSGCEAYNGANTTIEVQLLAFLECENENIMFNKSIDIIDKKISVEFSEKLVAAMIYKASLSIINHVGKGMTENTTFKTVEASPPAVRNLSANASSSKVRLLWNDPCPTNGNITQLCYRNVNSTSVDTCTNAVKCEIVTNYERCVDIAELDPQKYYTFMVAAVNSAGKGIFSELQVLTLVTIPGQPEKLNATRLSTSLELVLSQPVNPGGTRLNCTLLLKKRTQIIKQCTATVESETRNPFICKLDELKQGTRFTAESVCCNSAGCSEPLNSVVATLPLSPKLEGKLKVEDMDATSVTLSLPKVVMEGDGVRSLAVLVQQLNKEKLEMAFDSFTTKYLNLKLLGKHVQEESVGRYISSEMRYKRQAGDHHCTDLYIAAVINLTREGLNHEIHFVVGDGETYETYQNCPLKTSETYMLAIVAEVNLEGESKYAEMRLNEPVVVGVGGHGLVITLSILGGLLLLFILAVIYYTQRWKSKNSNGVEHSKGNGTVDSSRIPMDHFNQSIPNTLTTPATPLSGPAAADENIYENIYTKEDNYRKFNRRVPRQDVEAYLNKSIGSQDTMEEFRSVPSNIGKPMLDGQCPENKKKNRYSNNLPYDETRVKLSVIHDDPNTNYINANHVYGFGGLLKYIASQGPKDKNLNTIGDFWRMICEQHITVIIMVANFVEGGKKKVGEYISFGSNLVVEDYTVEVVNTDHHSHYNVSLVQVWKHGIAHTVIHYHYTNWPDHGVPSEAHSLGTMLRQIIHTHMEGGMVVHCSAGIGRTGTVLQVLLLHEMLMVQGSMDPLEVLQRLRECRARLVENVAQYNLSLQIFDEVMYGSNTSIVSINFPQQLEDCLKKNHNLYQRAKALPSGLTFGATSQAEYHYLNRNPTILPSVSQRIFLSMENGETLSQYINAIRVNGLDHPNEMVVTEHPLPTTLTKFWRLVVEKKCMSVVLINTFNDCEEDIFPSLLPRHDTDLVLGNYTIRTLHVANHSSFIQYSIEVFSKQDIQEAVTVYQITSWPYGSEVPSSPDALIGVSEILLQAHHHDTGPILLSCGDGVTGCGLMAAAKLTIEKLQKYKTVDVYRTVVYLLRARQEFFVSQAQFDFLYIVADKYLQDFDTYVNFQI
ncbi:receptor-type tyrosine-protein phosphatase U-like [Homarus americanus]|uniref:receptor-type tyrosine-protein phosphatase U-like n=1 Tax=Homarus americanus TaxID=6706 RepID=UPI001C47CAC6|nr:receptor-type tyrosine-protein phosphatase U-like [Homarus americanus]